MSNKIKVCFIGGLSNGKIVVDYLEKNKFVDLVLIITYPDETEKPRHIILPNNKNIIKDNSANKYLNKINKVKPDIIFVAGWSELLSNELLSIPKMGTIGFHPSKLPQDRGRSVLAWQIEDGYTSSVLTMFYYNELPDCGDIIAQENYTINSHDYVSDILDKIDFATYNLMRSYFPLIRQGIAPRKKQNITEGNFRRLRNDKDSLINWDRPSIAIYNKIRAISRPYPGAFGVVDGKKHRIWKSKIIDFSFGIEQTPSTLIAKLYNKNLIVKTRDGFLLLLEYDVEN